MPRSWRARTRSYVCTHVHTYERTSSEPASPYSCHPHGSVNVHSTLARALADGAREGRRTRIRTRTCPIVICTLRSRARQAGLEARTYVARTVKLKAQSAHRPTWHRDTHSRTHAPTDKRTRSTITPDPGEQHPHESQSRRSLERSKEAGTKQRDLRMAPRMHRPTASRVQRS